MVKGYRPQPRWNSQPSKTADGHRMCYRRGNQCELDLNPQRPHGCETPGSMGCRRAPIDSSTEVAYYVIEEYVVARRTGDRHRNNLSDMCLLNIYTGVCTEVCAWFFIVCVLFYDWIRIWLVKLFLNVLGLDHKHHRNELTNKLPCKNYRKKERKKTSLYVSYFISVIVTLSYCSWQIFCMPIQIYMAYSRVLQYSVSIRHVAWSGECHRETMWSKPERRLHYLGILTSMSITHGESANLHHIPPAGQSPRLQERSTINCGLLWMLA